MTIIRLHILKVGHADSILLEMPSPKDKRYMSIVDCGNFKKTIKYMNKFEITPDFVPFLAVTHAHKDHFGGVLELLQYFQRRKIEVGQIWLSIHSEYHYAYSCLIEYLSAKMINKVAYPVAHSDPIKFGDPRKPVNVYCLAPDSELPYRRSITNNSSLVLLVKYGKARILLSGDAQNESWSYIQTSKDLKSLLSASCLKVAHHGSHRGTDTELTTDYIEPDIAIISAGKTIVTKFGERPSGPMIEILEKAGIKVSITYDKGNIFVEYDGKSRNVFEYFELMP